MKTFMDVHVHVFHYSIVYIFFFFTLLNNICMMVCTLSFYFNTVERDKIIFPIIYNRRNVDIGKIMKEEYLNLQTVMEKPIMARPVIAYRKNPSLKDILVSTRLPTNTVTL